MNTRGRFRVNAPKVTHETIDGEVVIINLDTGCYYSTSGVGATMWGMLDAGMPAADLASAIGRRYTATSQEIESAVETLLSALQTEGLIVPDPTRESALPTATVTNGSLPFKPPTLHKYDDMQDLLLLDPIHDTADEGWPHQE